MGKFAFIVGICLSVLGFGSTAFATTSYTCGTDGTTPCGTSVQMKTDTIQKIQDAMALNSGTTMWMLDATGTVCYEIINQASGLNPIFVPNMESTLKAAQSDFANIVSSDKTGCSTTAALCVKVFPPAKCAAAPPTAGKCGAASGTTFGTVGDLNSSSTLCAVGTASPSSFSGGGPWSWSCVGTSSTDSSCTASLGAVNGVCGSASGGIFTSASALSSAALCGAGTPSTTSFAGAGPWSWVCDGISGGSNSTACFANGPCPSPYNATQLSGAALVSGINSVNPSAMFPVCYGQVWDAYRCQPTITSNSDGTYTFQMGMGCISPVCAHQAGTWTLTAPSGINCSVVLDSGTVNFSNGATQAFNWDINTGLGTSKNFNASWSCTFNDLTTALSGMTYSDNITINTMLKTCGP